MGRQGNAGDNRKEATVSEARKWKIIEHSWRNTSIENEDGRIVCELDLESFGDLNENNQDKYEQLQRADAELIASAPALRDERDRLREALQGILDIGKRDMTNTKYDGYFEAAEAALTPAGQREAAREKPEELGQNQKMRRKLRRITARKSSS